MTGRFRPSAGSTPFAANIREAVTYLTRSTGIRMFLILTLALLPLGVIALAASLQAIRTADLEKEALLRIAVTQSARKIAADIVSDRAALQLTANAMSDKSADPGICHRLFVFLTWRGADSPRFYIHDRNGRLLCGSTLPEPPGIDPAARFSGPAFELVPRADALVTRVPTRNKDAVAITYYPRRHLQNVADPATALQNRQLVLHQGDRSLQIDPAGRATGRNSISLTAPVDDTGIRLTMTIREPPATMARLLSLFLPLVMWFFAAAIGWLVVHRLLIRPLVKLRRAVAAYQPGEVMKPMRALRTPASEIADLGETFRAISEDVATHEAEMAEGLDRQRKLTREVHHRVKNNLQIIASLINLHARAAHDPEAVEAYASIQRRVDALSVVHRNHFAEMEENRGVGVRSLISELSASLRATAPASARRFGIQIDSDNLHISQDVAVPVAFLVTELVELAMLSGPAESMRITARRDPDDPMRAILRIESPALRASPITTAFLQDRFERVLTGLSRQLRAPLAHDADRGVYSIAIPVTA